MMVDLIEIERVIGYEVLPEYSYRLDDVLRLAHEPADFITNHKKASRSREDVGKLMFFAVFKLGRCYRGDSGELRVLRAWCEFFKYHGVPFVTVRTSDERVYILKERRAGEDEIKT